MSNIKKNQFKAVLIGETNLCTQCADYLINNNWEIIFLVSDDQIVINWANRNSIAILPTTQLNAITNNRKKIYLFSIINPHIIPKAILEHKNIILALNYHDAPLPKYAGINSTSWTIINNEKQHGVTIHKIAAGPDTGDIAAQALIPITADETAMSLNLKCSEQFLVLFKEVIAKIATKTLEFTKQDLTQRTYYGLQHIPHNYAIINGIKDLETINRLLRALTFGDEYENPVATVKIYLDGKFYIVGAGSSRPANNDDIVGRENRAPTVEDTISFTAIQDIYGNDTELKIKYQDLLAEYQLTNDDLQYLSTIKASEKKYKKQILKFLNEHSDVPMQHLSSSSPDLIAETACHATIAIAEHTNANTALALTYFILLRFFRDDFILTLYTVDENIPVSLRNLVENRNFIYVSHDLLNNRFDMVESNLTQLQQNSYTITKDFNYRYKIAALTDIAITLGNVACTDQHKLIISIGNNSIKITGDIFLQTEINSIATALNTVLTKNIKNEIRTKDLKHIKILSAEEYHRIVYEFNQTDSSYPHDKTIHDLFAEQVLKTPDNIAVVYEDKKLTYQELNNKANQLANYLLKKHAIKPDDLIALILNRSEYMIIAILAVLKAGAAYVPISPDYPDERIKYILDDTKTKIAINDSYFRKKFFLT